MRSFPPDVLLITRNEIRHARFLQSGRSVTLSGFSRTAFAEVPFDEQPTPAIVDADSFRAAIERLKARRRFERASVLLPDSWFRPYMIEVDSFPDTRSRQEEAVRWVLRKSVPNRQEQLRLAWQVIGRDSGKTRLVVLSSLEKSMETIESALGEAGVAPVLIEPFGLNLWNAIAMSEPDDEQTRLLVTVDSGELSMLLFRGPFPVFLRSKKLADSRSLATELRLSCSYLRTQGDLAAPAKIWLTGSDASEDLSELLASELGAPVERPTLQSLEIDTSSTDVDSSETSVMSAMGVFAA